MNESSVHKSNAQPICLQRLKEALRKESAAAPKKTLKELEKARDEAGLPHANKRCPAKYRPSNSSRYCSFAQLQLA